MTTEYRDYQWQDGEGITSDDLTRGQRYLYEQQWDAIYTLCAAPGEVEGHGGVVVALSGLDGAMWTSLSSAPSSSRILLHEPGILAIRCYDRNQPHDDGSPDYETIIPVVLAANQCSVTIPAAHPTLDRLDAVYLSFRRENGPTEQRDFEDATTRAKSTALISPFRKTRCFPTVISGTPGATTPGDIPPGPNSVVPPGEEVNPLNCYDALWCVVRSRAGSAGGNQMHGYDCRWPARSQTIDCMGITAGRKTYVPGVTRTVSTSTWNMGQAIWKQNIDTDAWFQLALPMDPFQSLTKLTVVASGITSLALYRGDPVNGCGDLWPANLIYDWTGKPGGPPWGAPFQLRDFPLDWPLWGNGCPNPMLYKDPFIEGLRKPVLYGTSLSGQESWFQFLRMKTAG